MDIVCGIDFSDASREAAAGSLAFASRSGGRVHVAHALELPSLAWMAGEVIVFPPPQQMAWKSEGDTALTKFARALSHSPSVVPVLEIGAPAEVLVDTAARVGAGLICVGSHGRSAPARWVLGSTAERVLALGTLPLLVFRGRSEAFAAWGRGTRTLRVLIAADFDESFAPAVDHLAKMTAWAGMEVHVAHACPLPATEHPRWDFAPVPRRANMEATYLAELHRHVEGAGLSVKSEALHVLWGSPARSLAGFARDGGLDMIVTGTHGRHGLERALVGSVAHGVLRRAHVPVLIAPVPRPAEKKEIS